MLIDIHPRSQNTDIFNDFSTSIPTLLSPFRPTSAENLDLHQTFIFPNEPPASAVPPSSNGHSPSSHVTQTVISPVEPRKRNLRQPTKSPYFHTGPEAQEGRVPRGASVIPWPSAAGERFGLIQEEFADRPFFVILVTIFLSKTKGSMAIPVFREFIKEYPTPESLVDAPLEDIMGYFGTLGLPDRAKQIKNLAASWVQQPPVAGVVSKFAYKYPNPASTVPFPEELFPESLGVPVGTQFEIGHLKGFGLYGMDSWRIFCRDALLGTENEEWKHVVPSDKELRSYIRWKWSQLGKYWREELDNWIPNLGVKRLSKPLYPSQERTLQGKVMRTEEKTTNLKETITDEKTTEETTAKEVTAKEKTTKLKGKKEGRVEVATPLRRSRRVAMRNECGK